MLNDEALEYWLSRPADALDELDRVDCEESLLAFSRRMWPVLEPANPMVHGWVMEAICEHLEAVSYGDITRLLITVPPGFSKSLLTNVFLPAWEWGPRNMPHLRYVAFSYSASLTERDNRRFRDVMMSHDYGRLFGDRFSLTKTGEQRISNDKTGWKLASSVGGVGTGERGDRALIDDAHNIKESESDSIRSETGRWFREAVQNRLNDMAKSAIIAIMQRSHEEDVPGIILNEMPEYVHLNVPMEWEGQTMISTANLPTMTWLEDPRKQEGELAWPQRFSATVCRNLKTTIGPYAWASQYQQRPSPRGGGIFKRDWWQSWDPPPVWITDDHGNSREVQKFPQCEFVLASLDGAFGQKQENDYTALTVWGVFREAPGVLASSVRMQRPYTEQVMRSGLYDPSPPLSPRRFVQAPKLILMQGWRKRLPLNGLEIEREDDESDAAFRRRTMQHWGIVQWAADTCRHYRVNRLLVEAKANGIDVANEIRRQYAGEDWTVDLIDPGRLDKVGRAYAVQHILADAMVYAPVNDPGSPYFREWADGVITEMSVFPKSAHDDYTDTATMAWKWLRDHGFLQHHHELEREMAEALQHKGAPPKPLYPV